MEMNLKHRKRIHLLQQKFTITELLFVIAIIAILASMLLPVLRKALEKQHGIVCLGNMRSLGIAFQHYANDFHEFLPAANGLDGYSGSVYWPISIRDYLGIKGTSGQTSNKNIRIKLQTEVFPLRDLPKGPFLCPSTEIDSVTTQGMRLSYVVTNNTHMNSDTVKEMTKNHAFSFASTVPNSTKKMPQNTILLTERCFDNSNDNFTGMPLTGANFPAQSPLFISAWYSGSLVKGVSAPYGCSRRHNLGSNFLMLSGSVRYQKIPVNKMKMLENNHIWEFVD